MEEETIKIGEEMVKRDEKGRVVSGTLNPNGRPKGKTLKEYQAEKFRMMTDEEKEAFLKEVAKDTRWKMSEGLPSQHTDITSGGKPLYIPAELLNKNGLNDTTTSSSESDS